MDKEEDQDKKNEGKEKPGIVIMFDKFLHMVLAKKYFSLEGLVYLAFLWLFVQRLPPLYQKTDCCTAPVPFII